MNFLEHTTGSPTFRCSSPPTAPEQAWHRTPEEIIILVGLEGTAKTSGGRNIKRVEVARLAAHMVRTKDVRPSALQSAIALSKNACKYLRGVAASLVAVEHSFLEQPFSPSPGWEESQQRVGNALGVRYG